jgi:hypothetical protein
MDGSRRVYFAKGVASVTAPEGAVARHGDGSSSTLVLVDARGAPIAAYVVRQQGPSAWAEEVSETDLLAAIDLRRMDLEDPCPIQSAAARWPGGLDRPTEQVNPPYGGYSSVSDENLASGRYGPEWAARAQYIMAHNTWYRRSQARRAKLSRNASAVLQKLAEPISSLGKSEADRIFGVHG